MSSHLPSSSFYNEIQQETKNRWRKNSLTENKLVFKFQSFTQSEPKILYQTYLLTPGYSSNYGNDYNSLQVIRA